MIGWETQGAEECVRPARATSIDYWEQRLQIGSLDRRSASGLGGKG